MDNRQFNELMAIRNADYKYNREQRDGMRERIDKLENKVKALEKNLASHMVFD